MIDQGRQLVGGEYPNCTFEVSVSDYPPSASGCFDLVLSNVVLQHMPPRIAARYVREFIRVLHPSGIAIFQLPSEQRAGSSSANRYVRATMNHLPSQWREEVMRRRGRRGPRDLPMHGIPRSRMLRHIERNDGLVVACIEDAAAGENWRSFHYIVKRT